MSYSISHPLYQLPHILFIYLQLSSSINNFFVTWLGTKVWGNGQYANWRAVILSCSRWYQQSTRIQNFNILQLTYSYAARNLWKRDDDVICPVAIDINNLPVYKICIFCRILRTLAVVGNSLVAVSLANKIKGIFD